MLCFPHVYYTQKVVKHVREHVRNKEEEGMCERLNRVVKKETGSMDVCFVGEFLGQKPRTRSRMQKKPLAPIHVRVATTRLSLPENRALPTNATNHSCRVPGPLYTQTTLTNKLLIISSLCVACYT